MSATEPLDEDARPSPPNWSTFSRRGFLLAVLLWLGCFALALHAVLTDVAFPPVYVHLDPVRGYPRVTSARSGEAQRDGLRVGDLLLRWGNASLHGATDLDLIAIVARETGASGRAPVTFEREGVLKQSAITAGSYRRFSPRLPAAVIFLLTAAVFVFRSSANRLTRSITIMLMAWAFLFCCTFARPLWLAILLQIAGVSGAAAFGLRTTLLFPHGVPPRSRWLRVLPFLFLGLGVLDVERAQGRFIPAEVAHRTAFALYLALLVAHVVLIARTYRRADRLERRKIKWVLWAVWLSSMIAGFTAGGALLSKGLSVQYYVSLASMVLIPLALLISITRFNLFDIDRILSATASLSLLLAGVMLVLLFAAPWLTSLLSSQLGVSTSLAESGVVFVLVAACLAASRKVWSFLDARLFVERAALQNGLTRLLQEVARAESTQEVLRLIDSELVRLLRPDKLAIYNYGGSCWVPCLTHGRAVAPALPEGSAVVEKLAQEYQPLCFERGTRSPKSTFSGLDVALIEALDARVALGIRAGQQLLAAVFIGPKGSGDVFVRSDLALLSSLSHAASQRCAALEERAAASGARNSGFRRYAPSALAARIAAGVRVEDGEREVTLMFVDIRGYSAYAEQRAPEQVFGTVTAYTQRVSEIVMQHHGSVVEFNGDGMMAVFGAPDALDSKEREAVQAALEIAESVAESLPPAISTRHRFPIGVGIATGRAFVGHVKGLDRDIWTALGAATNRAARLQALTRELGTDVLIDEATWRRLDLLRGGFARHANMLLRGHSRRLNLYAHRTRSSDVEQVLASG